MPPLPPGTPITLSDIMQLINSIVGYIVIISGVIVVGVIVWAGIMMATSGADSERFKKGQTILKQAVIGAIVIFGVGIIVRTIASFAQNPTGILR